MLAEIKVLVVTKPLIDQVLYIVFYKRLQLTNLRSKYDYTYVLNILSASKPNKWQSVTVTSVAIYALLEGYKCLDNR